MTVTALIAEDEPLLAAELAAQLRAAWPELDIAATVGDGASAVRRALELRPQVCFLDIRMPGQDGLEAAQALADAWPEDGTPFPLLVFVTAYDQHALDAFDRAAVDYLLKPVEPARLARCVARLQALLAQRAPSTQVPAPSPLSSLDQAVAQLRALVGAAGAAPPAAAQRLEVIQAGVGATLHLVPVDEVLYFEAADKYVRVVTAEREHLVRTSLRELLPQLDARVFWQVHRGTVVQARRIDSVTRDEAGKLHIALRGRPEKLAVSRLYAHLFKAM
jgi:DNA-binding LytR/AlgR family response regulator